jgi:selenocysteine-specific elongation factor
LQLLASGPLELKSLRQRAPAGLTPDQIDAAVEQVLAEGDALNLTREFGETLRPSDYIAAESFWSELAQRLVDILAAFHVQSPLRKGMPREELKGRLAVTGSPRLFDDLLRTAGRRGLARDEGGVVRSPGFRIVLDPAQEATATRYLAALKMTPLTPPSPAEYGIHADTLGALVDLERIVKAADGVYFDPDVYASIERTVVDLLSRDGTLTLAAFRDHFQTSRKYAQALLEYLDQRRITRRVGDERVRFTGAGAGIVKGEVA